MATSHASFIASRTEVLGLYLLRNHTAAAEALGISCRKLRKGKFVVLHAHCTFLGSETILIENTCTPLQLLLLTASPYAYSAHSYSSPVNMTFAGAEELLLPLVMAEVLATLA